MGWITDAPIFFSVKTHLIMMKMILVGDCFMYPNSALKRFVFIQDLDFFCLLIQRDLHQITAVSQTFFKSFVVIFLICMTECPLWSIYIHIH